jgi:hypothetical protein
MTTGCTALLIALCLCEYCEARFFCAINTGVCFQNASVSDNVWKKYKEKLKEYDAFVKNLETKLSSLKDELYSVGGWNENSLIYDVDFTLATYTFRDNSVETVDIEGSFGIENDRPSLTNCERKISARLRRHRDVVASVFKKEDGFVVSEFKPVSIHGEAGKTGSISIYPVDITHKDFPMYNARVLNGSGDHLDGAPLELPSDFFKSAHLLQYNLDTLNIEDLDNVLTSWYSAYQRPIPEDFAKIGEYRTLHSGKKTGMIFGMSFGADKALVRKDRDFGLYIGAETFFEINPSKVRIKNSFEIKSNSMGITPLIGIASKNKWDIYGLFGFRYSFKNVKSLEESKKVHKNKMEYDVGAGTTYDLSKKFNLSFRYIHTLGNSIKTKDEQKIKMHASRVVLSFAYVFGE